MVQKISLTSVKTGKKDNTLSAYHLHENFDGKFPSNGTGIFLPPKTGTGLSCTVDKIPAKFSLSLGMKPGTSNPNKWHNKFRSFQLKKEKSNTSKGITFFPENFHRDEPFHLNSSRNFQVFLTNGKRSRFDQMFFFFSTYTVWVASLPLLSWVFSTPYLDTVWQSLPG